MLVPSFAFAQAPAPTPSPQPNPQLNFCLKGGDQIAAQRNAALNDDAQCHVQLEITNEEFVKAQGESTSLKKKAEEEAAAKTKLTDDLAKSQAEIAKMKAENAELKAKLAITPPPPPPAPATPEAK
jgi:hypothetical protein